MNKQSHIKCWTPLGSQWALLIEEVKHREAEREQTAPLTQGLRYVLRELGMLFARTEDKDIKAQINLLEQGFRACNLTSAVKKDLNFVRRNNLVGDALFKTLIRLYNQHNIREWLDRQKDQTKPTVPANHLQRSTARIQRAPTAGT